jgi:hypothetical protein
MKRKKTLLLLAAGATAAAVMFVLELPEMVRYYKMTRL